MRKKIKIGNIYLDNNIVLAPLAGYTNLAYRKICKEFKVGLVFTEMISAKGLIYENDKTFEYLKIDECEHPIAVQLFGSDVSDLIKAAKIIEKETKADIIDINMGCPVKKVIKQGAGSELLKDIDKIKEIVHCLVNSVKLPISVKIRAGLNHSSINCALVAKACEEAGASLITIHGRTKSDLYSGKVNLDYIKMVKEAVSIPVIGNGDIKSISDYQTMLDYTGVDGVMVGRATLGNPWIIRDLVCYYQNMEIPNIPTNEEKIKMMIYHFEELLKIKPEKIAVLEMRTLASWYVKGFMNAKRFKLALIDIKTKEEFYELIKIL